MTTVSLLLHWIEAMHAQHQVIAAHESTTGSSLNLERASRAIVGCRVVRPSP
jgi:hypothetical protein